MSTGQPVMDAMDATKQLPKSANHQPTHASLHKMQPSALQQWAMCTASIYRPGLGEVELYTSPGQSLTTAGEATK